jgi:xylulokinase
MFLGIDSGTSSVKAILIDDEGMVLGSSDASLATHSPLPLWSEQQPEHMWLAVETAVLSLRGKLPQEFAATKAIGLAGQMHGAIFLDAADRPLRPAILWNDGRSHAQCNALLQERADWVERTGNLLMPGFTAPKVRWVHEHEPRCFAQTKKVVLPKDYIRLQLTGSYYTDMSDASGTSWLQVSTRCWDNQLIEASGLTVEQLPTVVEGNEATGNLLPSLANHWGLSPSVVVVGGGGDNAASALSVGVVDPGKAFLSLGTSGVYFVALDHYRSNPQEAVHSFCHCLPMLWHQMSVHLNGASCLTWVAELCGKSDIAALIAEAEGEADLINPVVFLPYLNGERTPHNDPHARGLLAGLRSTSKRADVVHGVLAGVALAFAQGEAAMGRAGCHPQEVYLLGGGARSSYWGKLLASCLDRPLYRVQDANLGAALGAARLARCHQYANEIQSDFFPVAEIAEEVLPDARLREFFADQKDEFYRLYHSQRRNPHV